MSVASEAEKFLAMQARKQGAGPTNARHRGRRSLQVLGESARRLLTAEADPGSSGVVAAGRGLVVRGVRRMVTPRLDLDYELVEDLTVNLTSTIFQFLDEESGDADGDYAVLGAGLTYRASEVVAISLGYETTVCDSDADENRFNVNVNFSF